jgi:hypothetical protein
MSVMIQCSVRTTMARLTAIVPSVLTLRMATTAVDSEKIGNERHFVTSL